MASHYRDKNKGDYPSKQRSTMDISTVEKESQECTFKPKLSSKYKSDKLGNRGEVLFNAYKEPKQKHDDIKTEDIEYERSKNELTFKPHLYPRRSGQASRKNSQTSSISRTQPGKVSPTKSLTSPVKVENIKHEDTKQTSEKSP